MGRWFQDRLLGIRKWRWVCEVLLPLEMANGREVTRTGLPAMEKKQRWARLAALGSWSIW